MPTTHFCPACRTRKPVDQFYGGKGRCKPCKSAYYKKQRDEREGPAPTCEQCGREMQRGSTRGICSTCQRPPERPDRWCEGCQKKLSARQSRWCADCAVVAARRGASHRKNLRDRKYLVHKGPSCEACGFSGKPCQLDVHHVDGNRENNNPSNLQTLCANCHRLVTFGHDLLSAGAEIAPADE